MPKYTVETLLGMLQSSDTQTVENALRHLQLKPTGDARIREAIKALLSDKRITIVEIKPTVAYGELAYTAGDTLIFEYAKIGETENVIVNTILPLGASEIHKLATDEEFKAAEGTFNEKMKNLLMILDKNGKVKRGAVLFVTRRAELLLKRWGEI